MDALISGQAGVAMLCDGQSAWSVTVDSPEVLTPCAESEVLHLFAGAKDVVSCTGVSREEAVGRMREAWRRDRALRMTLILLDSEEDEETRVMAAECAERHFADGPIEEFVADRLYAAPLPIVADLPGAKLFAGRAKAQAVGRFLEQLDADQPQIAAVRRSWDGLGAELFVAPADKRAFEQAAIAAGAFRRLAQAAREGNIGAAHLACLQDARLTALAQHRMVLGRWVEPLKPRHAGSIEDTPTAADAEDWRQAASAPGSPTSKRSRKDRRNPAVRKQASNRERFARAKAELEAVEQLLLQGRFERARDYAADLVERQLREDGREVAVLSLCNLSRLAKSQSLFDWQFALAERAVKELPTDVQARTQLADSCLCRGEFQEALRLYDETCRDFPRNEVARNGRAEVLRKLARLEEALRQYEETCRDFPPNVVPCCGRAEVLRELGRLEEALRQYEATCRDFPRSEVARCGRAEVLRELGRLEEALRLYEATCRDFPRDAVARNGRAEVLRELGRLDDALLQYEATCGDFPRDEVARNGRAEVLRDLGRLDEALRQYDDTCRDFPRNAVARNGRASVLMDVRRYEEALALLPTGDLKGREDWIVQHIRGMIYLRHGEIHEAERIFEHGVRVCPYPSEVAYFRTALAVARIQLRRFEEADAALAGTQTDVADVLRLHVRGEQRKTEPARDAFERLRACQRKRVRDLRDLLASVYLVSDPVPPLSPDLQEAILAAELRLIQAA